MCSTQVEVLHFFEFFHLSLQESETKLMAVKENEEIAKQPPGIKGTVFISVCSVCPAPEPSLLCGIALCGTDKAIHIELLWV